MKGKGNKVRGVYADEEVNLEQGVPPSLERLDPLMP